MEVKSTPSHAKHYFEISHRELQAAERSGAAYHLVRVYGAGSTDVRLLHLKDPVKLWRSKVVGLFMAL